MATPSALSLMPLGAGPRLAWDAILQRPTRGIPSWLIHPMDHGQIERLAGAAAGAFVRDPSGVYLAMQKAAGTCFIDQWIPTNPLSMKSHGYEGQAPKTATQGAARIERNGIEIDSPESVAEHLERFVFPQLRADAAAFNVEERASQIVRNELEVQTLFGPDIAKAPYAVARFPAFAYGFYGYEAFFMAYAVFPELMEQYFSLQADLALLQNRAAAQAYAQGGLPPLLRLDHDMADSRGTLVDVRSLDRIWFPHFARCLKPLLDSDVRLIWHCDGNLMEMVPRLLEVGLRGFQGFQYEDGMDYERICRMKDRRGRDLIIIAGVSVTRTLPLGGPDDVRRELRRLVEGGPRAGLLLGCSSTITPGVPWENIVALVEGLRHYQVHGRG